MEVRQTYTTFKALSNFACIFFEPAQGSNRTLPNDDAIAQEAHFGATGNDACANKATSDSTEFWHAEYFAYFGFTGYYFFILRGEHAHKCALDVFQQLVDDFVGTNFNFFCLGEVACFTVGSHIETNESCIGCCCKGDVVFGNSTNTAMNECRLYFRTLKFAQALGEGFK